MTNRRTTKQLLVSVVLLIVCILMLLGTTFAWFTDNATSPDNKVEAGTLDVQLWMYNGTEYENIGDSAKPIFGAADSLVAKNDAQDTLWEPGKTQVVYLKIVNNGSLDLKYKVSIDVKDNADDKDLYEVLEYAIDVGVDSTMAAPRWDGGKKVIPGNNVDTTDVKLPAKEEGSTAHEHYFTLSVHMLEEAGNVYQGGYVEFDIKVAATQLNSEEGSFGSDYDIDATYPEVDTLVIPETGTSPVDIVDYDEVADQVDTKITLPAGSAAGTYTLAVSNENVVTDAEGNTVSSFDIELTVNGEKVPAGTYVVEKYVGEYLNDVKVTHKGEPVAVDAYDPTTGYVTFTVDSFSPFAVSYYRGVINNVDDLANIAKGGNFILMSDIELAEALTIAEGNAVTLDLNGNTLSADLASGEGAVLTNNGTITITNGTITSKAVNGAEAVVNNGTMVLADVTINGAPMATTGYPAYAVGTSGKLTIEAGTEVYADRGGIRTSDGAELIINGGKFIVSDAADGRNMMNHVIYAYGHNTTVTINGGYFEYNHTSTGGASVVCPYYATIIVNGGDFRDAMDDDNWTSVGNFQNYMGTKNPVVYGGTYDDKTVLKHVAEGYTAIANNDGTYIVIPKTEGIDLAVVANYPHLFTDGTNYYVYDAQGLIAMRDYWQANQYANKMWGCSYNIMADIDATGYTWNSVYVVVGHNGNDGFIIDGHDHTISGLTIKDSMFTGTPNGGDAGTKPGEVKNITFDNVKVTGDHWTAVVWGNTYGEIVFDDVHIVNSTISGKCNTAAFVGGTAQESGDVTITFNNCSVENTSISANGAFSGVKGDWASDPNGANVFISRAFNKAYIVFVGENVSESNTVTNTNGVIGGGIYGYTAFADGWWAGFGTCDKFENWNGLVVTSNVADVVNGGNFLLTDDIQNNSAIKNDTSIDLNGNTFEATSGFALGNNADFTITNGNFVANNFSGYVDARPDSAEGSVLTFENVVFTSNYKTKTFGTSTNRLGSVVEICPAAAGAHVVAVFKNCTFNNAKVLIEGMSGKTGTFEAIFENCTFNALTSSAPIEVVNYIEGTITVKNCTFNLECTSSVASAICVSSSNSTKVTVVAENNIFNAVAATASGEAGTVEQIKVHGTPANIKFISAYDNATVTETGTVKSGIAK